MEPQIILETVLWTKDGSPATGTEIVYLQVKTFILPKGGVLCAGLDVMFMIIIEKVMLDQVRVGFLSDKENHRVNLLKF